MDKVAKVLEVTPMKVYEVATFYTMFNRSKVGKYFIQLCGTTPCMVCGSEQIKKVIEDHLHIKVPPRPRLVLASIRSLSRYSPAQEGETTSDGMFTLREVECMGSCANAPMVQLNDDYYECLSAESMIALLEACKRGQPPPVGRWGSLPMNGQVSCEGPLGKTSLTVKPSELPSGAATFRADDLTAKVDPASVKATMGY